MNNEELSKSLRTEIQTYLKNTVADLQQEIAEMQERVGAEVERLRGEVDKTFQELLTKGSEAGVDDDFARVVTEHLQIAYEDGTNEANEAAETAFTERSAAAEAAFTERNAAAEAAFAERSAAAVAEAEARATAAAEAGAANAFAALPTPQPEIQPADYRLMRDSINEISVQASQAEILKSLVKHSSNFAPRGAFFIVKNEHLIGWRIFGSEMNGGDESVREVFLPVNSNTLLGDSIKQNSAQTRNYEANSEDAQYLQKLNFGEPEYMTAIPLVVRGRGVAVLYADAGQNNGNIDVEALETLVRVASLTVELLASAKTPANSGKSSPNSFGGNRQSAAAPTSYAAPIAEKAPAQEFAFAPTATIAPEQPVSYAPPAPPIDFETYQTAAPAPKEYDYEVPVEKSADAPVFEPNVEAVVVEPTSDFTFDNNTNSSYAAEPDKTADAGYADNTSDNSIAIPPSAPESVFSFDTAAPSSASSNFSDLNSGAETAQTHTGAAATIGTTPRRYGERNLELPIDVPEEERRLHNDARRFARLLVSEIKLYNEQKVKEGRQVNDLYSRLREAIDRSREMYIKRVAPPVAARFDYFNYELVNTLAEGDESKLGGDYPGASV